MDLVLRFDGAAEPNPGPAGYGVVIERPNGDPVHSFAVDIGWATNNQAEWHGCIAALRAARIFGARRPLIIGDSKLVIMQASGVWKVKKPHLRALHDEAMRLADEFESVSFRWEGRDENAAADALASSVLRS